MKLSLFEILQAYTTDPDSPNILLTVSLTDLHQLVVDTIDATRERLLPLYMEAEKDKALTKKEVADQLGVCETTVYNMTPPFQSERKHPLQPAGSQLYYQPL